MKKVILIPILTVMLIVTSCANRKVSRIDPDTQVDLSGRWNDTDSKLVANEMIKDVLARPWRANYEQKAGKKPTVIVGSVRNKTSEHIEAVPFIKAMEREFINSGVVSVVQSGDERNQLREERNEQQIFASEESKKKWGKEKGADYMMNGTISSIIDQYKNQRIIYYKVNLELTDLETNEKVWIGEKEIKKYVKN
ncbi:MAG: penicillin-binding protein activator LpoB [Bacteroidota bacterium]